MSPDTVDSRKGRQVDYVRLEGTANATVSQLVQQDKVPWYRKPNLRFLYLCMVPTCLAVEAASGFNSSIVGGLQAVPSWLKYFNHPRSVQLGLMTSTYSLGALSAVPFVSTIVDSTGRRFPIFVGGVISIMGGIIQGCAQSAVMFCIARFILGFASVLCIVSGASLIGELPHPKERAVMGCLFSTTYDLGAIASAGVILWTFAMISDWGWRIPSFLQTVLGLLQVSFVWFLPESPRWLISNGRGREAYDILVKYHAEGERDSDFVEVEYNQIEKTLGAEIKAAQTNKNTLSTAGMQKRVIIATLLGMSVQLCGVGLISDYLAPILERIGIHDDRTKNIVNLCKVSWGFINGIVTALIAPRHPRRTMFLVSTTSIFVVFTSWTVANAGYDLTHNKVVAQIVIALIFLYSPAYNLGFAALTYPYLVELFPFHVRTKGIAVYQWWSRSMAFFNQFVNPIGIDVAGWRFYIVYCLWNAFQVAFVYFIFPETSGRTLEELTFLYESDQEVLGRTEFEVLHGDRENGMYGTVEIDCRRAD